MKQELIAMEVVLLAGRIMVENGADMARVDDTLYRIAHNAGLKTAKIFETTTGIMMSLPRTQLAQVEPINHRTIDLEKVARVNDASRAFAAGKLNLLEFKQVLTTLDETAPTFKFRWQALAAAVVGAALLICYGGRWQDFLPTLVTSGGGYSVYWYINNKLKVKFVSEFIAAVCLEILALSFVKSGLGGSAAMIAVGAVMPLVPGVPLTNAVRDVLAGHILSGIARATEGLLSAGAIGMGIALVLRFW